MVLRFRSAKFDFDAVDPSGVARIHEKANALKRHGLTFSKELPRLLDH